jgi:hypothetical protein
MAIQQSNQHADQQIDGVKKGLKDGLKEVSDNSDQQISTVKAEVKSTDDKLSDLYSKTTIGLEQLGVSINKVGKPDPPIPVKLEFTLWGTGSDWPILTTSLRPNKEGVFSVDFTVTNRSPTAAHSVDVWVDICTPCIFAKEPDGFDRPSGMPDQTRHMVIGLLNPEASLSKRTIEIKVPRPTDYFVIGWRYSCELCGGKVAPAQIGKIEVLPAVSEKQ